MFASILKPRLNPSIFVTARLMSTRSASTVTNARAQEVSEYYRIEGSLIPDTMEDMVKRDSEVLTAEDLKKVGSKVESMKERKRLRRSLDDLGIPSFEEFIESQASSGAKPYLKDKNISIFQVNIGLYCNQACNHCHVESSPKRKETMSREVAERVIQVLKNSPQVTTLDITGGAPEMHEQFKFLVTEGRKLGLDVIDRCNLTVMFEEEGKGLAQWLADNQVHVVASLPCYSPTNVKLQRGSGVFERSVQALIELNSAGYGVPGSDLKLDLVYNPGGAFLAPSQDVLRSKYKEELWDAFGIQFNDLFCITNMPVKRFADSLYRQDKLREYMELLVNSFNPNASNSVMCRNTASFNWDGVIHDCDFNLAMDIATMNTKKPGSALNINDINSLDDLSSMPIEVANHCFGCTAGMGSSCQGEVA